MTDSSKPSETANTKSSHRRLPGVSPCRRAGWRRAGRRAPAAILVTHGWGSRSRFKRSTISPTVSVRSARIAQAGAARGNRSPLGGERLQRLDLAISFDDGSERDVHVYEAYWAPLTKGV